jgi:GT2 family glycosyltransferase
VLAQTYEHWRLTVSEDGGPTDPVRRAVEPYLADERIRLVAPVEHLGLARHKSSLADAGDGKYLAHLDDDDCWMPAWLQRRVDFLERHEECVLVWGGHFDIGPDGERLAQSAFPFAEGVHSSADFIRAMLPRNFVTTPSVLMRRDAYARAGNAYDDTFVHINDFELWLRLALYGPVGFLAVHDCGYRVHPQQMSRRHDQALDHLRLIDHLDGLFERRLPELRLPAAVRRRQKADRQLSAALDAVAEDERGLAARRMVSAARLDPRALGSKRAAAALAAMLGGRKLRARVDAMRR